MNKLPFDARDPGPVEARLHRLAGLSASDLRFLAAKWAWEFLAVVLAVLAATLVYIMIFRDPVFESEARLFVRLSQEQAPPRTLVTPEGATLLTPATSDVTSEIDLLLNADLVERVIDEANLMEAMNQPPPPPVTLMQKVKAAWASVTSTAKGWIDEAAYALGVKVRLDPREALARQIRMSIGLQHTTGSSVVALSMRWPDRGVPEPLLRHYLDAFMQFRLQAFEETDHGFFSRRRDEAAARIATVEQEIAALRGGAGIEEPETQRKLILAEIEEAGRDLAAGTRTLAAIQARQAALAPRREPGGPILLANLPDNPLLTRLDERSIEIDAERRRLAALPTIDGRDAEALDRTLTAMTEATFAALAEAGASAEANLDAVQNRIDGLRDRLAGMARVEAQWNDLHVQKELALAAFRNASDRLAETESANALRRERLGNIVVIQEPSAPTLASGTRNATVLAVGAVFALLAAASWVAVREFLDRRIWRPADLEGMAGMPMLAATRRGPVQPQDFGLAAAALKPRGRGGFGGGTFGPGPATLAYMAAGVEPRDAAARVRALAQALLLQGWGEVRILNLGRWNDGAPGQRPSPDPRLSEVHLPDERAAMARLGELAAEQLAPQAEGDGNRLTLIATPPLFSSPVALRAAQTAAGTVFDIAAGRDETAQVEAAAGWVGRNGGRLLGAILADVRRTAARFGLS